jgi:hypothetical protein
MADKYKKAFIKAFGVEPPELTGDIDIDKKNIHKIVEHKLEHKRPRLFSRLTAVKNIDEQNIDIKKLDLLNMDYRSVKIPKNAVIYCDIPYKNTKKYYNTDFDYEAFCKWVKNNKNPVFFTEQNEYRDFICVYEFTRVNGASYNKGKIPYVKEKLYWNGVK